MKAGSDRAQRWRRSSSRTVAVVTAGLIAVLAGGIADAATGGSFVLGRANFESTAASLTNTAGTPLSLVAKSGYAPLAVNSTKQVARLNASYLGGLSAAQLQRRIGTACSTGIASVSAAGGVGCVTVQRVLTVTGTLTVPAGVGHLTLQLWGAGGGGAGGQTSTQPAGGGNSGYQQILLSVTRGQVFDIAVGLGGAGGAAGAPGGDGAVTTLSVRTTGGNVLLDTVGGGGGGRVDCSHPSTSVTTGRAGTMATGVAGLVGLVWADGPAGACFAPSGIPGYAGTGGNAGQLSTDAGLAGGNGLVIVSETA